MFIDHFIGYRCFAETIAMMMQVYNLKKTIPLKH